MFWTTEKKEIAEESYKTKKTREKLRKQLEDHQKQITPQALEEKTIEIQQWIARRASERVVLRDKSISLFDENQNAAKLSQKVSVIAEQLKTEIHKDAVPSTSWTAKKIKRWTFGGDLKKEPK